MKPVVAASLIVSVAISLIITAFAWPAKNIAPRDVPIGVAGPAPFVEQVQHKLPPGAFVVTSYPDRDAATAAIKDREIYGAVVAGNPPTVLTAPAGSVVVAQVLDGLAAGLSGQPTTHSTPVVSLPADDPRGSGFGAGALPMVLGGLLAGVVCFFLVGSAALRGAALVAAAVLSGFAGAALLGPWLGILPGGYLATAGVMMLGFLAIGATVTGLAALIGPPGIGIAAIVVMLVGNPFSGATSAPEMLPSGWGELGQWLPPGAVTSLLRSVSYFDGAAAAHPLWILLGWIAFGVVLLGVSSRRPASSAPPGSH